MPVACRENMMMLFVYLCIVTGTRSRWWGADGVKGKWAVTQISVLQVGSVNSSADHFFQCQNQ